MDSLLVVEDVTMMMTMMMMMMTAAEWALLPPQLMMMMATYLAEDYGREVAPSVLAILLATWFPSLSLLLLLVQGWTAMEEMENKRVK